ncbi:MAG TPA: tripartite tricarboxylate transporter TctB family protein [Xanthobacteraceae bacterium]|nr:tripartite tricarboxylate transporter TctB family protein [Xanthobacteraceae bacterium]
MSSNEEHSGTGPGQRAVEAGTAIAMIVFGLIVIYGSLQVGIGWGAEGPRSGFFPFYLGVIIVAGSIINLVRVRQEIPAGKIFAEWGQLRQVLLVVIPTTIYVLAIPFTGIYLASFVLMAGFMMWLGRYSAAFALGVSAGVVVIIYLTFERWFLVPLPKGPIENLLGL